MNHRLRIVWLAVCFTATAFTTMTFRSHAVVLNDDYFAASGGDPNNVVGTLDAGYAEARVSQYADWIDGIFPDVRRYSEEVLIGDINLDGQVTADLSGNDDFSAFIADWRSPSVVGDITIADLNEDHIIDLLDFAMFRQAVIDAGGVQISLDALYSAVPEPGTAVLAVGILACLTLLKRSPPARLRHVVHELSCFHPSDL